MGKIDFSISLIILLLATTAACTSPEKEWQKAQKLDTIEAYEQFCKTNKGSVQVADALKRIEEKKWLLTVQTETMESYLAFVNEFPKSVHTPEANDRIGHVAVIGTLVGAADDKPIEKRELFLVAVPPDGPVVLGDMTLGTTNDQGDFSILMDRTKLSKMDRFALVTIEESGDIYISQPPIKPNIASNTISIRIGRIVLKKRTNS